jgi:lipoate-protein ligase A
MAGGTYPRARWRLIVEEAPHPGAWNMAVDEALVAAVANRAVPPTLRFYQWQPACLSLGKRQPLDGVDPARCRSDGVDLVRRPTGGWAILHTDELTYSIAVPPDDPRASGPMLDAYRQLSAGLVAGLRVLGVAAEMNPVSPLGTHNASAACFEVPSAYEITVAGQKLVGSAQARPAGRVLQHGSLPLHGDMGRVASYLWFEGEDEREHLRTHLRARATTLAAALGHPVSFAAAAAALSAGFATALDLDLVPGALTPDEQAVATARSADLQVTSDHG